MPREAVGGGGVGGGAERLHYSELAPPARSAVVRPATRPRPVVRVPTRVKPLPTPTPPVVPAPVPQLPPAPSVPPIVSTAGDSAAGVAVGGAGTGGGTGNGTGVGAGNGTGPGTGGSPTAAKVKALAVNLPLLGADAPASVRPFHLVAVFDVSERGTAHLLSANATRDGSYNARLRSELLQIRFRAAVLPDGTPVRDTVALEWDF